MLPSSLGDIDKIHQVNLSLPLLFFLFFLKIAREKTDVWVAHFLRDMLKIVTRMGLHYALP